MRLKSLDTYLSVDKLSTKGSSIWAGYLVISYILLSGYLIISDMYHLISHACIAKMTQTLSCSLPRHLFVTNVFIFSLETVISFSYFISCHVRCMICIILYMYMYYVYVSHGSYIMSKTGNLTESSSVRCH